MPEHSTNQSGLVQRAVTDYMFVNNNRAGGIMGFPVDFGQTDRFGVVQVRDISKIARNIPFGVMALANRAPSDVHYQYDIWLEEASHATITTANSSSGDKSYIGPKRPSRKLHSSSSTP